MEKNVPGLKRLFRYHCHKLHQDKPTLDAAEKALIEWSAKYVSAVISGDASAPQERSYGAILDAYARREALKQYIKELQNESAER